MIYIQWQDHQGHWQHYTSCHHEPTAYRIARERSRHKKKRHRLLDVSKNIIDIIEDF